MGRPSKFTPKLATTICDRIAKGESVRRITEDKDMPSGAAIYRWLEGNVRFREQYTHAREKQADFWAEQIIEISDATEDDKKDGQVDHEHIQRSRLRVDSRKWLAGKLRPKVYGDTKKHELTGADGGPIDMKWTIEMVEPQEDL